ncbi:MAG TPA: helix-turn-helix domain-containing protein [Smithellaceae bacterium]|nr:helix-turn-helix domain-containing protein [Smithellaceae bacterium]
MSENQILAKPYLNEKEVATITGRALSTLRNERFMRKGLPYYKIGGRSIRYKTEDVIAYMESRRIAFDEGEQ